MVKSILLFSSVFLLLITGCKTSYITSSWKSPVAKTMNFKKILVVAIIRENDRSIQVRMESHTAGDLKDLGYNAVTSLDEYGPGGLKGMTKEEAINKIRNSGVDAVITIVLLNKEWAKTSYPGHPRFYPSDYYHQGFGRYFTSMLNVVQEPSYYVTNTKYSWESNLYDLQTESLLYSVQTETFDPMSPESMGHEYGKMIIKNMIKNEVLGKQQKELKPF